VQVEVGVAELESREGLCLCEQQSRATFNQTAVGIAHVGTDGRWLRVNQRLCDIVGYAHDELLERTRRHVIHPANVGTDLQQVRRLLCGEAETYSLQTRYVRKDGSVVWINEIASLVHELSGEPKYIVYVVEDISRSKRMEERLDTSLNALVALHEAGRVLSSTLEPEEIGRRLLKIIHGVSDISAAIVKVQDEPGQLRVLHAHGPEDLWRQGNTTPEAEAARHRALETKERQSFRPGRLIGGGMPPAGLCLPLTVRDRFTGVLEVYGPETLIEKAVVEMLESLTRQAASALENARLHQQLAERERRLQDLANRLLETREEERRRVACDIHDGLVQVAAVAHQNLRAYAEAHAPGSTPGRERLDRALQLVELTGKEARRIIATLRPAGLDASGLGALLRSRVASLRTEDWKINYVEALEEERLPAEIETALYWVVQEALANVRKHARTTRANITLRRSGKGVCLEVRDWGRGFDGAVPPEAGATGERVGLCGMRERVTLVGGEFRIHSRPGAGTSVIAEIPLHQAAPAHEERISSPQGGASPPARLVVADDQAVVREGLRTMLASEPGFEVVGEAADGHQALELCRTLQPDLVLMDVRMPGMNGLAATLEIKSRGYTTSILMLSTYENPDYLLEAVQAGASGYVLKDAGKRELIDAMRGTLRGENPLNQRLAMQLLRRLVSGGRRTTGSSAEPVKQPECLSEPLTPREVEVLRFLAQGQTNRQISQQLVVSPSTIKVHVEHILAKLGVSDRTQAAVRASEAGLLNPTE
jgi:PAS domain S-box-containing protein